MHKEKKVQKMKDSIDGFDKKVYQEEEESQDEVEQEDDQDTDEDGNTSEEERQL